MADAENTDGRDERLDDLGEELDDLGEVSQSEMMVRLFSRHQRWLHGYVTALLGNSRDADDVVQEVCVVMWQKHEEFEIGTNFVSWMSVIAYRQVQKHWRNNKRQRLFQSESFLDQLAETLSETSEIQEDRRHALTECASRLKPSDRELVSRCYGDERVTVRSVAQSLGRSENTVYKALNRIRQALYRCIEQKTAGQGGLS